MYVEDNLHSVCTAVWHDIRGCHDQHLQSFTGSAFCQTRLLAPTMVGKAGQLQAGGMCMIQAGSPPRFQSASDCNAQVG